MTIEEKQEKQEKIINMPNDHFLCIFEQKYSNKLFDSIGFELYNLELLKAYSKLKLNSVMTDIVNTNINKQIVSKMEQKHTQFINKMAMSMNMRQLTAKLKLLHCITNEKRYYVLLLNCLLQYWQKYNILYKQIKKKNKQCHTDFISNCIDATKKDLNCLNYHY